MGTFVKYLIYIALFIVAALIIKNLWDGSLTGSPAVTETVVTITPESDAPQKPQTPTSK